MSKREKCVAFPGKERGSIWKWGSRPRNWEVVEKGGKYEAKIGR